jgi:hypothetical protein
MHVTTRRSPPRRGLGHRWGHLLLPLQQELVPLGRMQDKTKPLRVLLRLSLLLLRLRRRHPRPRVGGNSGEALHSMPLTRVYGIGTGGAQ